MQRILKFTQLLSILVFLGVLLFVYAYLPEQVGIDANAQNEFSTFLDDLANAMWIDEIGAVLTP